MRNGKYLDHLFSLIHGVKNSIVANSDSVSFSPTQLFRPWRTRVVLQREEPINDSVVKRRGKTFQLFLG
jgi:hypothetical protein